MEEMRKQVTDAKGRVWTFAIGKLDDMFFWRCDETVLADGSVLMWEDDPRERPQQRDQAWQSVEQVIDDATFAIDHFWFEGAVLVWDEHGGQEVTLKHSPLEFWLDREAA